MTGERAGRYQLEEVIGVGSFATVHRALDTRLDAGVVVKILAENHSLNPEVRERFIAEGRALRRVTSPHVVTIHDIGESERQQPYLVLAHADRGTLADRVTMLRARGWTASREDVLVVARSLAAAIEAVHRAGLVHRDLSPGNVLLTTVPEGQVGTDPVRGSDAAAATVVGPDERLVVADLGMCKDLALNSGLTVAGGTSGFRPPEQDGPGIVDTRADLWALSTLMRWLCAGAAPGALPPGLFTALDRSTATDPEERHPDVADWLADVETALAAPPRSPTPSPDPATLPAPTAPARRRRPLAAVVLGCVALILGLLGGTWLAGGLGPTASAGGATVAVSGPAAISVGEATTFAAEVQGVDSWVWTLPTGEHVLDEPTVTVTARSSGSARLVLRARAPDGTDLETVLDLTVQE